MIIGYFDANKGVNLVSKYWKTIAYENRDRKLNNMPQSIFFLENDHIEKIKQLMIKNKSSKKIYVDATNKYKDEDINLSDRKRNERKWEKKIYRKAKRNFGNLKNGNKNNTMNRNGSSNDNSTKKVKWGSVESSTDQSDYNNQNENGNGNTMINEGIKRQGSIDENENENEFTNIALSSSSDSTDNENEPSTYVEDTTPKITFRSRNNGNNEIEEEEEMDYRKKERREINYISKKFDNLGDDVVMNTSYNSSPQRESQQIPFSPKANSPKLNSPIPTPIQSKPVEKTKKLYKDEVGYDDLDATDETEDDSYMTDYDHLLVHVKEIRSESQLTSLISYIQDGYISIENSDNEKRKLKKLIRGTHHTFFLYPLQPEFRIL